MKSTRHPWTSIVITPCLLNATQCEVLIVSTRMLISPHSEEKNVNPFIHLALIKLGRTILLGTGRTLDNSSWKTNYTPTRDPGSLSLEISLSSWEAQPSISCPSSPTAAICCWRIKQRCYTTHFKAAAYHAQWFTNWEKNRLLTMLLSTVLPASKSLGKKILLISPQGGPKDSCRASIL